jgi:hypothetical protein
MSGRENLMRRSACFLAVLGLVLLTPSAASGLPSVTLKAAFVPIPGFAGTGNIPGARAAARTEYRISGTEYDGSPPPLIGADFYLPSGTSLHAGGFPTCSKSTLEQVGPVKCAKGSAAGPIGTATGFVTFGGERVEESLEVSSFYAPGGGIEFFSDGHAPVSLEVLSSGHYTNLNGGGGYGPELVAEIPLVASVPGAPYASFKSIGETVGGSDESPEPTLYRVPKMCPSGGLPFKAEVTFAENGELSRPEVVSTIYKAPCPTGSLEPSVPGTSVPGTGGIVTAPSNMKCVSRRDFPIHVQQIKDLTYRTVTVYVNGRQVAVVKKGRFMAQVDLRGLPKGRYTVKITVMTTTGRRLTGTRAYHTCAPKSLPSGKHRL